MAQAIWFSNRNIPVFHLNGKYPLVPSLPNIFDELNYDTNVLPSRYRLLFSI